MSAIVLSRFAIMALVLAAASNGAAAWQRPRAQPVRTAEACPALGEGFVKIPGSDTCVRLGGSVRIEALHAGGAAAYYPAGR